MSIKLLSLFVCLFMALDAVVAGEVQVIPVASNQQSQPTQLFILPEGLSQFDFAQIGKTINGYGSNYNQNLNQLIGQLGLKTGEGGFQIFTIDPSNFKGLESFNQITNQFSDQFAKSGISESKFVVDAQKYMSNPNALVEYVSTTFKLPREKLTVLLDREDLLNSEGHPISKSMKILEKLFVPNGCRSKVLCQFSRQFGGFRQQLGRVPPQWFEGSGYYKAANYGLSGEDCQTAYATCKQGDELLLANPFSSLSVYAGPSEVKKAY